MIDWHSHVLPGIDDGSRDVEESLGMLQKLGEQGVRCVVATPHFYADEQRLERFLEKREQAYSKLQSELTEAYPQVICGAEVKYYPGIGRMEGLERLTIGSTKMLLLEMPFSKWTDYTMRELSEMVSSHNLTFVLAHIDRYMGFQSKSTWEKLLEAGFLMQVNASYLHEFGTKRKALRLFGNGGAHFLGSDCHNLTSRPPRIGEAYDLLRHKLGEDFLAEMTEYGYRKLKLR
jgi:protein-tyrosine phosphatase